MSLFEKFIRKYPQSDLARKYIEFEGKGFAEGLHGSFAQALFLGDICRALDYADAENTTMLHDLLFPKYMEQMCADCECIHPDDIDPSDYCNEGYQ
jgi:hypothetical protein